MKDLVLMSMQDFYDYVNEWENKVIETMPQDQVASSMYITSTDNLDRSVIKLTEDEIRTGFEMDNKIARLEAELEVYVSMRNSYAESLIRDKDLVTGSFIIRDWLKGIERRE